MGSVTRKSAWGEDVTPPPSSGDGPGYPLPCLGVMEPPPGFALRRGVKRYPEPMAHGPEACEPSHPLWPRARRPVSRHTLAEAVDTGCQRDIPVL